MRREDSELPAGRRLGAMETALAVGNRRWPLNMATVLCLDEPPDPALLRQTLDELQRAHPPLGCRIERRWGRYRFRYGDAPPIPLHVVEGDDRTDGRPVWLAQVEDRLNTFLPTEGPLADATLVRDAADGSAALILTFEHAIVDGVSAATLLGELLTTYAALRDGATPTLPVPEVPATVDRLTPARYRPLHAVRAFAAFGARATRDEVRFRRSMRGRAPGVRRDAATIAHTHTFDEATTRGLMSATREHHVTVHGLLHAAVLASTHEQRYPGPPAVLRTVAFADLRPHLTERPPAHALAPYIALMSQDVVVAGDDDLWELAGRVQDRLRASVKGPAKFIAHRMSRPMMRGFTTLARLRMASTAVSHTGAVRIDGPDAAPRTIALHAFVSNLGVGPEISFRTGMFGGRLTLDAMALDTDMTHDELAALVGAIVDRLQAAAE